jgi:predicted RNA binding protein YcfA (HicA-like mRNA interferase family)
VSVLSRISGRKAVTALMKVGYARDRQAGSHIVLRQTAHPHRRIVVPDHVEVAKGPCAASLSRQG